MALLLPRLYIKIRMSCCEIGLIIILHYSCMLIMFLCDFNGHGICVPVICVLSFPTELRHLSHITQSIQAFPLKEDLKA